MRHILVLLVLFSSVVCAGNTITIINTPPPIDIEIVNRIWIYVKQELSAPDTLPTPSIVIDWEVPLIARMGYQFPTEDFPENVSQISIAPRTVDMWPRDMISWGIGHEMTHYVFLMKENHWQTDRKTFVNKIKHHCNKEFIKITKGIADLIYSVYHSDVDRRKMYDEVRMSCTKNPEQ
jgi:hypothetical protein